MTLPKSSTANKIAPLPSVLHVDWQCMPQSEQTLSVPPLTEPGLRNTTRVLERTHWMHSPKTEFLLIWRKVL